MLQRAFFLSLVLLCGLPKVQASGPANEPSLAANRGRIYFSRKIGTDSGWSILSIDPDGNKERVEVPYVSGMGEYNPSVSKDGKTILYNTYRYGGWKLVSQVLGSKEHTLLTRGEGYDTNGQFSPDGKRILFEKSTRLSVDLYLMDANGSRAEGVFRSYGGSNERVPVWTPNGKAIVYFSDETGKNQIYRYYLEGKEPRIIQPSEANDFAPAVSPDGSKIAFYSDRDFHSDVFVMKADGSGVVNLTTSLQGLNTRYRFNNRDYWIFKLAWSPDSKEIAFISPFNESHELYIVGADGENLRRITRTVVPEITPTWAVSAD